MKQFLQDAKAETLAAGVVLGHQGPQPGASTKVTHRSRSKVVVPPPDAETLVELESLEIALAEQQLK